MAKPFMRVSLAQLPSQNKAAARLKAAAKPTPKPMPKPKPAAKLKATPAEEAAIARGNRAQAMDAREAAKMRAGTRKAPQTISITVRERTTPPKKK